MSDDTSQTPPAPLADNQIKCPDPVCEDGVITVDEDEGVGDILECETCGAEVEVVSVKPLQVELLEEEK
jgi:lysine biosynthesis protein LysW